jgi:hypothetical protein
VIWTATLIAFSENRMSGHTIAKTLGAVSLPCHAGVFEKNPILSGTDCYWVTEFDVKSPIVSTVFTRGVVSGVPGAERPDRIRKGTRQGTEIPNDAGTEKGVY